MKLNHINIPVSNPKALATFFCDCFEFVVLTENDFIMVLRGIDGFILNISRDPDAAYPAIFHVGFTVSSRSDVEAAFARVVEKGYHAGNIEHIRRPTGYEALEFMIQAPCGISVEVQNPISI